MIESDAIVSKEIQYFSTNKIYHKEDLLAIEEPLEIHISFMRNGIRVTKSISVTMRTPGQDEELSVGFLFTEGIIRHSKQLKSIPSGLLENNKVLITLNDNENPNLPATERNFYTTSSCGVCGKSSIDAIKTVSVFGKENDQIAVNPGILLNLTAELERQQSIFKSTGGLHASALFDLEGGFLMLREDVGRHNALDKAIGALFLKDQLPLRNHILLLSGRASFELIQKAGMAGIRIVVAIGAPSSLAVELAEENNVTLIGFLRKETFNIYSGHERITAI